MLGYLGFRKNAIFNHLYGRDWQSFADNDTALVLMNFFSLASCETEV